MSVLWITTGLAIGFIVGVVLTTSINLAFDSGVALAIGTGIGGIAGVAAMALVRINPREPIEERNGR